MVWLREGFHCRHEEEYIQGHLEESRVEKESIGLNTAADRAWAGEKEGQGGGDR